ncbi:MAG: hypothetical protein M8861_06865 [marine benthic group bacterium]|nr:hypothetical protein [Gemmatimonadota bacterium]
MSIRAVAMVVLLSLLAAWPASAQDPLGPPREVEVGILMTDMTQVNGADQSFTADVFVIASWIDPELVDGSDQIRTLAFDDIWHPTLLIYNQRSVTESLPREVMVRPDGTVTYLQRYTGDFSAPMDLREFPRDRQEFFVWLVAPTRVGANVTLVPTEAMAAHRVDDLSISDWKVGEANLTLEAFQVAAGAPVTPGIKLTVEATRRVTYYTIQVLIPLIAIVMMAYAVFWIAPTVVPTRVGVVVTTMLTLIAYRFMLANHVPPLSYLTRLDWFMLGATVLVVATLFTMAGTSYLVSREQDAAVKKIDRAGRVLYPIVFLVYSLIVWLG